MLMYVQVICANVIWGWVLIGTKRQSDEMRCTLSWPARERVRSGYAL